MSFYNKRQWLCLPIFMNYKKKGIPKQTHLFYGADYNPDQWQKYPDILERDIELMKELGATSASIGIFAWTSLEPEEGRFEFGWLDRVMDRFATEGLFVFLATPSGSKPMWMSEKYPEIRRVNQGGARDSSGGRHNHCPSSFIYREKVSLMNRTLAERYGKHPALALWHIGNELSGECHCANCKVSFQAWLKARYVTLENLNESWWSNFWNHTFTDWAQIPTYDDSIDCLELDWLRFVNDQHLSFLKNEMASIRELTPDVPCTTNFMCMHLTNNYWQWAEHIDVISNDIYPMPDDREGSWARSIKADFVHSMMRGMSGGKSWMQMECAPSSVNWGTVNKLKRPRVHRQEILQAVANGADTIHYFQWRKSRGGFEKFHGAVVDHEGSSDSRVFKDCAQVGSDLQALGSVLQQDCPKADIAIIYEWESRWAMNASCGPKKDTSLGPFPVDIYTDACLSHYEAVTSSGQSADVVSAKSDFSDYKMIIAPSLYMVSEKLARKLNAFVEGGGILVGTYLTGYVDPTNLCWLGGFPGSSLRQLFGIWNEEIDYLYDGEQVTVIPEEGNHLGCYAEGVAFDIIERIHPEGADVIARAGSNCYIGSPLITRNSRSKGAAYYIGAKLDSGTLLEFYRGFVSAYDLIQSVSADLPLGVVARKRQTADGELVFLFNYNREEVSIDLQELQLRDTLTEELMTGAVQLASYSSHICEVVRIGG